MLEADDEAAIAMLHRLELGIGVELDAFVAECLFDDTCGLGGHLFENVGAALDLNDFTADAPQKLGEFAGDDAAAEDDDFFRFKVEVEHFVAGPARCVSEARYWRDGYS